MRAAPSDNGTPADASPLPLDATRPNFMDKLPLNNVPVVLEFGGEYREFILDGNENSSGTGPEFSIDVFDMYVCNDPAAPTYSQISDFVSNPSCTKTYDIGAAGGSLRATTRNTSGSGSNLDYRILIPAAYFGAAANAACQYNPTAADCGYYIVLYSHMGGPAGDFIVDATFE